MNATIGIFEKVLPDWNSLDSVRRAHSDLERTALGFFGLLVLFEILAHRSESQTKEKFLETIGLWCFAFAVSAESLAYPYGQRNDTLSENVIGSLDLKAQHASEAAASAVEKSGTAVKQAEAATKTADGAKTKGIAAAAKANLASGAAEEAKLPMH